MSRAQIALCGLLFLSVGVASARAQNSRPRRVSDPQPPVVEPSPAPAPNATPPPSRRPVTPSRPAPPVMKTRERPLWADGTMPLPDLPPIADNVELTARLQTAIDARLGTPYRYGSVSGATYDCSGFVWSVFQDAGAGFQRDSARRYWSAFTAPQAGDEYRFGTLVFFNRLSHVGIVAADGQGFYHASTSKGVMYSSFDKYWSRRIDGFRRVPMATTISE